MSNILPTIVIGAVVTACLAADVHSAIGARKNVLESGSSGESVELYKQILSNTLPPDTEIDITLPNVRKSAFASQTNLKKLTIRGVTSIAQANEYFIQGSSVEELVMPDVTSWYHFVLWGTPSLKILRVPKVKSITNMCYIGTSALTDVFIDESTCAEILAMPGFPGMTPSNNSNYANVVFHGSDGNVVYNGTAWVKE